MRGQCSGTGGLKHGEWRAPLPVHGLQAPTPRRPRVPATHPLKPTAFPVRQPPPLLSHPHPSPLSHPPTTPNHHPPNKPLRAQASCPTRRRSGSFARTRSASRPTATPRRPPLGAVPSAGSARRRSASAGASSSPPSASAKPSPRRRPSAPTRRAAGCSRRASRLSPATPSAACQAWARLRPDARPRSFDRRRRHAVTRHRDPTAVRCSSTPPPPSFSRPKLSLGARIVTHHSTNRGRGRGPAGRRHVPRKERRKL